MDVSCDGVKRWRRHGRGSRVESQSGGIVPSLATTVIGPLSLPTKIDAERIASVARREMSGYYGVVQDQAEDGAAARLRNEDIKSANVMGFDHE
jgi:hypothetical protein